MSSRRVLVPSPKEEGFGGVEDDEEMKAVSVVGHHQQHQENETWGRRNTGGILG